MAQTVTLRVRRYASLIAKLRNTTRAQARLALLIFVAATNGCAGLTPVSERVIYEMRSDAITLAFSGSNTDEYLHWLDDKQLLFEGQEKNTENQRQIEHGTSQSVRALYILNIETGRIRKYSKEPLRSSACYADGFIAYVVSRNSKAVRLEGMLGEERDVLLQPLADNQARQFNPFTCKLYERIDLPPAKFNGGVYPLRPEDGWIERVKGGTWTRPPDGSPRKLVIPTLGERSIHPHKFSSYSQKYLFYYSHRDLYETWAFSTDGSLEALTFPVGPWGKGQVEPVRGGRVLRSRNLNARWEWNPGDAGLYLHSPQKPVERLATGIVYAMSVARNGCLIALYLDSWDKRGRTHRLMVVDVCERR